VAGEPKTEPPTARRLRRARREGDHPISSVLVSFGALAGGALLLPSTLDTLVTSTRELLQASLAPGADLAPRALAAQVLGLVSRVLGPAALLALALGLAQTGAGLSVTPLGWDARRLNPVEALRRFWSATTLVSLLRWAVTGVALGFIALRLLLSAGGALAASIGNVQSTVLLIAGLCQRLLWGALGVSFVASVADAVWVRGAWYRRLRMTREEVLREKRDNQGDEALAQARLRAHRELLANARLGDLPNAVLLVVARPRLAVALSYAASRDTAPRILMQATGRLAETLEGLAPGQGVPVLEDPELAQALAQVPSDEQIPPPLYAAVSSALRRAGASAKS
jgi:flagellar biosynthesis protein FlhB